MKKTYGIVVFLLLVIIVGQFLYIRDLIGYKEDICQVILNLTSSQATIALPQNDSKQIVSINSNMAYCLDSVWVSADVYPYEIAIQDSPPTQGWGGGFWSPEDVIVNLFQDEKVISEIDLTDDLKFGDKVYINIVPEYPQGALPYYYNEETGLAIWIKHLDRTFQYH